MTMRHDPYLFDILSQAIASDYGLRVETSNVEGLRQKLYIIRAAHEAFSPLSFRLSPVNPLELWIIKTDEKPPSPAA
jgi:hypothetical protein